SAPGQGKDTTAMKRLRQPDPSPPPGTRPPEYVIEVWVSPQLKDRVHRTTAIRTDQKQLDPQSEAQREELEAEPSLPPGIRRSSPRRIGKTGHLGCKAGGDHVATGTAAQTDPSDVGTDGLLLTVEEAAQRLRLGRTLVYQLISSGELESVTVGRLRRVP